MCVCVCVLVHNPIFAQYVNWLIHREMNEHKRDELGNGAK